MGNGGVNHSTDSRGARVGVVRAVAAGLLMVSFGVVAISGASGQEIDSASARQEAAKKLIERDDEVARVEVSFDSQHDVIEVNLKGKKYRTREIGQIEKLAQAMYPGKIVEFVDAGTGESLLRMPRTMLGVILEPISGIAASQLQIPDGEAVVVEDVFPGLPAAKAQLQKYDIILSCNGEGRLTKEHFTEMLTAAVPGDRLNLILLRHGEEIETEVVLDQYNPVVARRLAARNADPSAPQLVDPMAGLANSAPFGSNDGRQLVFKFENQGQFFPMEMSRRGQTERNSAIDRSNVEIRSQLQRIQAQMDRMEYLLQLLLEDRFGDQAKDPRPPANGKPER